MIIKASVDKEKARSIIKMTEDTEEYLNSLEIKGISASLIARNYYEIIKELGIVILLLDGYKAVGDYAHKEIIAYLGKKNVINGSELAIADDLRIKRNYNSYEGRSISADYLVNRKKDILRIIKKLRDFIEKII